MLDANMGYAAATVTADDDTNVIGTSVVLGVGANSVSGNSNADTPVIAIGKNAVADMKTTGTKELMLSFGQSTLPGPVAIGTNAYARTGTVQIGAHTFSGTMGGVTITETTNASPAFQSVYATTIGSNSYNSGSLGTVIGAYSISAGDGNIQNFGSNVIGSLNSIRSTGYSTTAGVANSIVGTANIAEDANGTLIFGAGNKVSHATGTISAPTETSSGVDTTVDAFREAVKTAEGGGAALVIGGGNEAEYVRASQLIGTNNTLKGSEGSPSEYNLINGTSNEAANVSDSMIIGRNRQLTNVSETIVIGSLNTKAATTSSRAVVLGHEANVLAANGGVALGYGSVADRAGFAESTIPPFSGELYGINLNGITDGAVSVGTADTLRQLINLADATEPTDAVNLRQLRGGLSFEVISGGQSQGKLAITDTAPKFAAGEGLIATVSGDTITFAVDTESQAYMGLLGEDGTDGVDGINGKDGVNGKDGENGPKGDTGPQGEKGDKGDKGDPGSGGGVTWKLQADGDTADTVEDGATVQFKSGSNIAVSRSGANITIGAVDAPVFAGKVTAKGFDASGAKITNVAPGTISSSSTDAVNGSQLWGAASSVATVIGGGSTVNEDGSISAPSYVVGGTTYTTVGDAVSALDSRFDSIRGGFDDLRDDLKITSALSAALAGLHPIQYDPKEPTQFMASVGNYRDKWAFALGLAHYTREDVMIHAGVAMSENSRAMMNAGLTWKFGRQEDREAVAERYRKGPITSVAVLQQENEQLLARVAQLQQTSTAVQARLDALERRVLRSGK